MGKKPVKYALCQYSSYKKSYCWYCPFENLEEGDKVIVRDSKGYSIVTFIEYTENYDDFQYANNWVVDRFSVNEAETKIAYHEERFEV